MVVWFHHHRHRHIVSFYHLSQCLLQRQPLKQTRWNRIPLCLELAQNVSIGMDLNLLLHYITFDANTTPNKPFSVWPGFVFFLPLISHWAIAFVCVCLHFYSASQRDHKLRGTFVMKSFLLIPLTCFCVFHFKTPNGSDRWQTTKETHSSKYKKNHSVQYYK